MTSSIDHGGHTRMKIDVNRTVNSCSRGKFSIKTSMEEVHVVLFERKLISYFHKAQYFSSLAFLISQVCNTIHNIEHSILGYPSGNHLSSDKDPS